MQPTGMDYLPLWALLLTTLAVILAAAEGGYRLGRWRHSTPAAEKEGAIGAIVTATLGLLAFLLAFTFGLAASRFDTRRELFQQEVNAIGTTYLRASFLPGDQGARVRALLREYVEVHIAAQQPGAPLVDLIRKVEKLQEQLWHEAVLAGRQAPNSPLVALFVASLNEVIDLHANRVTAAIRARIPTSIWAALYFITILSLASMGYLAGLSGTARSIVALGTILSFVVILLLIADLDRPREGWLRVNPQAMVELRASMRDDGP